MTREELCIHACKYAIGELTRKGSSAFITSAHDGRQQISWVEVVEWLKDYKRLLEQEPCEDAISRQAIIDMTGLSEWFDSSDSYNEFVIALSELPSATPQPKMGHWIAQDIHNCHTNFKCSECDYIHSFMHLYGKPTADYTYCPNCGAKMVEPQESEDKR